MPKLGEVTCQIMEDDCVGLIIGGGNNYYAESK
jgi:hypothetical protein